jgi:LmbE family N-acetylglucosaminyl deacetylase
VTELVIAPHPDDEAIGCGGIIAQNSAAGERLVVAFLSSGECGIPGVSAPDAGRVREREAAAAADILGIADLFFLRLPDGRLEDHFVPAASALGGVLTAAVPNIIRIPHPQDGHADHSAVWPLLQESIRISNVPSPEILAYEIWTPMAQPDYAEDITPVMDRKLAAIGCYASQLQQLPYDHGIAGLNAYRGAFLGGCRYAEAVSHLYPSAPIE